MVSLDGIFYGLIEGLRHACGINTWSNNWIH